MKLINEIENILEISPKKDVDIAKSVFKKLMAKFGKKLRPSIKISVNPDSRTVGNDPVVAIEVEDEETGELGGVDFIDNKYKIMTNTFSDWFDGVSQDEVKKFITDVAKGLGLSELPKTQRKAGKRK